MTDWKITRSSSPNKIEEIDINSSNYYVYERRNIHQEQFEHMGETYTEWVFEERAYTKEEYDSLNSLTTQLMMQQMNDLQVEIALLRSEVNCLKN